MMNLSDLQQLPSLDALIKAIGERNMTPGWLRRERPIMTEEMRSAFVPAHWFDGLDVPLTQLLEPMFFEEHPAGFAPITQTGVESPFRFPWAETQRRLAAASADEFFGRTIALAAPTMPTITLKVHGWDAGWRNRPYRHSANTIHAVMQGRGSSTIGGQRFDWEFGDTLAIPAWTRIE